MSEKHFECDCVPDLGPSHCHGCSDVRGVPVPWAERFCDASAARDEQVRAAAQTVTSATSDGYHTFAELYDYRMLYNAHAAQGWLAIGLPVVKSWRHSDGELAFGGGWFIVVAELPTGQVANHYKAEHWGIFNVPVVEIPPEYDGHTPADAAERLRESLRAVPAEQKESK